MGRSGLDFEYAVLPGAPRRPIEDWTPGVLEVADEAALKGKCGI